jgi:PKD repeat protein
MVLFTRALAFVAALAVALGVAGCSLEDTTAPPMSAPSEFATSVTLAAVPDQLPRDGQSQSVVTFIVRDANARPVAGQRLILGVTPSTARLSASEVVTDANGRATATVTAPPSSALGNTITVLATPVGEGADAANSRSVSINLVGASNTTAPTASFTVTPTSPEVNQLTSFDASASTDEGAACGDACTYSWDFGDGTRATGRIVTKRFTQAQIFNVALTVTDAAGSSATARTNVTVTAAAKPTISFTVAPTSPTAGQQATFTATTTVASNHRVSSIAFDFGDGTTASTTNNSVVKTFSNAGTFIVTATVTDDLGQTASTSSSVTVQSGVTASFTFSPTAPKMGDSVIFDGSASTTTGGATIEEWSWDFGDGSTEEEDDPSVAHTFPTTATARTYVVRLTVTDRNGRTGTTTKEVTVSP